MPTTKRLPISRVVRDALNAARKTHGLTYEGIAAAAGLDVSQVYRFIKGKRGLSLDAFDKLTTAATTVFRVLEIRTP